MIVDVEVFLGAFMLLLARILNLSVIDLESLAEYLSSYFIALVQLLDTWALRSCLPHFQIVL